jgi:hypothetical protein
MRDARIEAFHEFLYPVTLPLLSRLDHLEMQEILIEFSAQLQWLRSFQFIMKVKLNRVTWLCIFVDHWVIDNRFHVANLRTSCPDGVVLSQSARKYLARWICKFEIENNQIRSFCCSGRGASNWGWTYYVMLELLGDFIISRLSSRWRCRWEKRKPSRTSWLPTPLLWPDRWEILKCSL